MTDRFAIVQKDTARFEGVNADHPKDPGGKTRFGITEATNRAYEKETGAAKIPIFQIPYERALAIYRRNYWRPTVEAYRLVPGVDRAVYDAAVNSGVSRGIKWLKAAAGSNDHSKTAAKICDKRLAFMMSLKIWKTFGKGWSRRVAFMKAKSVAEALEFMAADPVEKLQPAEVPERLQQHEHAAEKKAATANTVKDSATIGAAGEAVGHGGLETADPSFLPAWADWTLLGVFLLLVVAAVWFFKLRQAREAEAEEFATAARGLRKPNKKRSLT